MNKIKLNEHVFAYEFDELIPYITYIYVILEDTTAYIIDTFCGSFYMDEIKKEYENYTFVVINTHYHFDHIWGNVSFENTPIYAHQTCIDEIQKHSKQEIEEYGFLFKGVKKIVYPNTTFTESVHLSENIQLIYTPGHTIDSISIIDQRYHMLFVGDNLEKPMVQYEKELIFVFLDTLKKYLEYENYTYHSGHTLSLQKEDILKTIQYLENAS